MSRLYRLDLDFQTMTDGVFKSRDDPFKPAFTIVIFIHYKPRIAVAILDL